MSTVESSGRYPAGIGWVIGSLLGVVFGVIAWYLSGEVIIGVIIVAATGTPLAYSIEHGLDTRPLTAAQSRMAFWVATAGVLVGAGLLAYVVFFA